MQEIITVWVNFLACSHSEKESYKNLLASVTELVQQQEEETLTQIGAHRAQSQLSERICGKFKTALFSSRGLKVLR